MRDAGLRVHSQTSRGYGEGLLEAIHLASGDVIIEFNPDGNSIPADIPRIVAKINEGYDLVIGSRYREGAKSDDDDWLTATGNWMFTAIVNLLFRTQYTDSLVGFRAYRRAQALRLDLDAPGLSWPCQTSTRFARAGLRVTEIFAHEPARIGGKRKMMPFRTGLQITKLILRDFFTFHPKPVPGIDPAHTSFLHRFFHDEEPAKGYGKLFRDKSIDSDMPMTKIMREFPRPQIEVEPTDYGMRVVTLRRISDANTHV